MKGDAFEKMTYMPEDWHSNQSMEDMERWAATLLRRHHAKIRRMVLWKRNAMTTSQFVSSAICHAQKQACDEIIAALDRMAKEGKP